MKTYTEQDLRLAFQAGNYFDEPLDEDEYIESLNLEVEEESTIGFTYEYLKLKLNWDNICAITGLSYYCKSEGCIIENSEVFRIKKLLLNNLI